MNKRKERKKSVGEKKKRKKKWEMKNWGKVCVGRPKNMGGTYSDVFENVAIEF